MNLPNVPNGIEISSKNKLNEFLDKIKLKKEKIKLLNKYDDHKKNEIKLVSTTKKSNSIISSLRNDILEIKERVGCLTNRIGKLKRIETNNRNVLKDVSEVASRQRKRLDDLNNAYNELKKRVYETSKQLIDKKSEIKIQKLGIEVRLEDYKRLKKQFSNNSEIDQLVDENVASNKYLMNKLN